MGEESAPLRLILEHSPHGLTRILVGLGFPCSAV